MISVITAKNERISSQKPIYGFNLHFMYSNVFMIDHLNLKFEILLDLDEFYNPLCSGVFRIMLFKISNNSFRYKIKMIVKNQMKYNKSYCTKTKRKSSNRHFQNFPAQNKIASSKKHNNQTIRFPRRF